MENLLKSQSHFPFHCQFNPCCSLWGHIMCSLLCKPSFFPSIYLQPAPFFSELCYYYWKLITSVNLLYDALLHFKVQLALYLTLFEFMTHYSLKRVFNGAYLVLNILQTGHVCSSWQQRRRRRGSDHQGRPDIRTECHPLKLAHDL